MSNYAIVMTLLTSFLLTEAIELPAAWLLGVRSRDGLLLTGLVNVVTNPAIVCVYIVLVLLAGRVPAHNAEYLLEPVVVLVETWLYATRPGMLRPEALPLGRRLGRWIEGEGTGADPARIQKRTRWAAAFVLALILNGLSYGIGVILNSL